MKQLMLGILVFLNLGFVFGAQETQKIVHYYFTGDNNDTVTYVVTTDQGVLSVTKVSFVNENSWVIGHWEPADGSPGRDLPQVQTELVLRGLGDLSCQKRE